MEEIRLNSAVKTLEKERPREVFLDLVTKKDNDHFTL